MANRTLNSKPPVKINTQDEARRIYLKIFLIIALFGYAFAWLNAVFILHTNNLFISLFILVLVLISLSALVTVSATRHSLYGRLVLHLSLFAIIIFTLLFTQYGLFWVFLGPVIIILIENQKVASILFALYIFTLLTVQFQPFIESRFNNQSVITTAVCIFVIGIYLFLYKSKYDQNSLRLYENEQRLEELTRQLAKDVALKEQRQGELTASMSDLSRHNQLLSDSHIALENVLEDEKELRLELEQAKADVERQVQDRTAQLHEEHARLQATIDSLPVGLVILDEKLTPLSYNSMFTKVLGQNTTKPSTDSCSSLLDELNLQKHIKSSLESKLAISLNEIDFKQKVLRVHIAPILRHDTGSTIGVVIILDDITEDKVLERSKDEFLSIASHELRTPLTAVRGNAKLLSSLYREKLQDKTFNELTTDISLSADRLLGIVNDYLETSSLEQGKIPINSQPIEVENLILNVVHEMASSAREKNLRLTLTANSDRKLPVIYADPERVSQVLVNLISNAIHYTEKGGVTVHVEQTKDNKSIVIKVSDTGAGISDKNKKLLFHKFQKADDNILTRDWRRSTGLGLYIAKLLVEAMGGELKLGSSTVGKGSTFVFTLPQTKQKTN